MNVCNSSMEARQILWKRPIQLSRVQDSHNLRKDTILKVVPCEVEISLIIEVETVVEAAKTVNKSTRLRNHQYAGSCIGRVLSTVDDFDEV